MVVEGAGVFGVRVLLDVEDVLVSVVLPAEVVVVADVDRFHGVELPS